MSTPRRIAPLTFVAALTACATGSSLNTSKALQIPAAARSIAIHATAETKIEQPYLILIEQQLEARLGALGRFDSIRGTIGRTPSPTDLRLEVKVLETGGMQGYSVNVTLGGDVIDVKGGTVLGQFEVKGRANNSPQTGATTEAALGLALEQVVSYIASSAAGAGAVAGPPRKGFMGKWAGTRSLNGERGVVAINETFEFDADKTFVMTAEKKYSSDKETFATNFRGCVELWTLHGSWVASRSQIGFIPTEAVESVQGCVDPKTNRPDGRGKTNLGPLFYSNVGSSLILKAAQEVHSLQPR